MRRGRITAGTRASEHSRDKDTIVGIAFVVVSVMLAFTVARCTVPESSVKTPPPTVIMKED